MSIKFGTLEEEMAKSAISLAAGKIRRDIEKGESVGKVVPFYAQSSIVMCNDVQIMVEVTAKYPGWEEYIRSLFPLEDEDEDDA